MNPKRILALLVGVFVISVLTGCGDDDGPTGGESVDQSAAVIDAVDTYLSSGKAPVTKAASLHDLLYDGDAMNDPYVLSVRSATDYANGHIPGAANIPWREIADPAKLEMLPDDRQIVVYCYTGHTGGVATTVLSALGYDAVNMKFGMTSWTTDTDVRVATAFSEETDAHDFPLETDVNDPPATNELPNLDVTTSTDTWEICRAASEGYVASDAGPVKKAADVHDIMNDGDDSNDFFILSVRSSEHYELGHIPGAINIPWRSMGDEALLKKLPTDQPILVYCYTGHTGGVATTALRMLGYEAYNMKWGIMAWTTDSTVRVSTPFSEETEANDFPVESSS